MCKNSQKDSLEQIILICLNTEWFYNQILVESLQLNTVFSIDKKYLTKDPRRLGGSCTSFSHLSVRTTG